MTMHFWIKNTGDKLVECSIVGFVEDGQVTIRTSDPYDSGVVQRTVPVWQVFKLTPIDITAPVSSGTVYMEGYSEGLAWAKEHTAKAMQKIDAARDELEMVGLTNKQNAGCMGSCSGCNQ